MVSEALASVCVTLHGIQGMSQDMDVEKQHGDKAAN